jgi:hypothetical protein
MNFTENQRIFIEDFIEREFRYMLNNEFYIHEDDITNKNGLTINRLGYIELTLEQYLEVECNGDIFEAFTKMISSDLIDAWETLVYELRYVNQDEVDEEEWIIDWLNTDIDDAIDVYLEHHTTEEILDLVGYKYELPMLK